MESSRAGGSRTGEPVARALAGHGWSSTFFEFRDTPAARIEAHLRAFVPDASAEQVRAWDDSIPPLQREVGEVIASRRDTETFSTILEYNSRWSSAAPTSFFW